MAHEVAPRPRLAPRMAPRSARADVTGTGRAAHLTIMSITSPRRQPSGFPLGGQFAAARRGESTVDLNDYADLSHTSTAGPVTDVGRLRRLLDEQDAAERETWRRVSFDDWNRADAPSRPPTRTRWGSWPPSSETSTPMLRTSRC